MYLYVPDKDQKRSPESIIVRKVDYVIIFH